MLQIEGTFAEKEFFAFDLYVCDFKDNFEVLQNTSHFFSFADFGHFFEVQQMFMNLFVG